MDYVHDLNLEFPDLGIVAFAESVGSFDEQAFLDRFGEIPDIRLAKLVRLAYLELDPVTVTWTFLPPPGKTEVPQEFHLFYKAYPSDRDNMKCGPTVAWKVFKKHHKDYKQQLHKLLPAITALNEYRAWHKLMRPNDFLAEMVNMQTYLGPQRRWESAIPKIPTEGNIVHPGYKKWLEDTYGKSEAPLDNNQFAAYCMGVGDFVGIKQKLSDSASKSLFRTFHDKYFTKAIPDKTPPYQYLISMYEDKLKSMY